MDCLRVDVTVLDTSRAKRERKLSLSHCGKIERMKRTVDSVKEGVETGEDSMKTGSMPEHQLSAKTLLPSQVSSPPGKALVVNAPAATRTSPQQKQAAASRRRKAQDKKYVQESETITGLGESKKIAICETFFMPVSKRRKLLAEENNVLTNHHDTKRSMDEFLKGGPTGVASTKAKSSGVQSDFPKAKKTSSKTFSGSSQVSECVLSVKAALDSKDYALRNAGKPIHPLFLRAKPSTTKAASSCSEVGYLEPCPPTHVTQCLKEEETEPRGEDQHFHRNQPIVERCKEEALVHRLMQRGHSLKDDLLISRSSLPTPEKVELLSKRSAFCPANAGTKHGDRSQASSSQHGIENLYEYLLESAEPRRKLMGANVQPLPLHVMDGSTSTGKLKERYGFHSCGTCPSILVFHTRGPVSGKVLFAAHSQRPVLRLSWYKGRHDSLHNGAPSLQKNMLWTDLYQPRSPKEVCGNDSGVESLNNWLHSWRERMIGVVNGPDPSQTNALARAADSDSDRGWFEDDSDSDTGSDEESDLHSTLLVTGPTGCGKTAAIYACAAEQGLTVIEINASSCRSGASLMQKFGKGGLESEAMGKWSGIEGQATSVNDTDEIHTMPQTVGRLGKGKKESKPHSAVDSKSSKAAGDRSVVGRKLYDCYASKDCEESLGVSAEEPQPRSPRKKKMTVILFEDVDLHFEEDRGFLASLVQLAKKTKRPIILTSNSRQPGLPQILEKTRIDFCYPSPKELTLHASMVCLAERVACSPWMVSRLVESCQCDMRKVLMSLQFWRQDSCSSLTSSLHGTSPDFGTSSDNVQDISERSVTENLKESRRRLCLRPCVPNLNAALYPGKMDDRCLRGVRASAFRQWDFEARYLYDLDIHHIILPEVFSSSSPCLLSLDVASRMNAAVSELEKHEVMNAVKDAEQQGLALQAQLDAAETERKALRRAKDATRRASRVKTKVVDDEAAATNNYTEGESIAIVRFAESPPKNIREARALARSPLRPEKVRPKRGLRLYDSDDDEGRASQVQADGHDACLSHVSNPYSEGIQATDVQVSSMATFANEGIIDDLEDKDVILISSSESVPTVKRKRLQQVLETDFPGSRIPSNVEVYFRAEIVNEDVNLMADLCSEDLESLSSRQIFSASPFSETDVDKKLSSDLPRSVSQSNHTGEDRSLNQDQTCELVMDVEADNLDTTQMKVGAKAKLKTASIVFDVDLNLQPCPGESGPVEYVYANHVNTYIPEDGERGEALESPCGNVELTGSKVVKVTGDGQSPRLGCDLENITGLEKAGCSEMEDSQIKFSGDVEADDTTNISVPVVTRCEFVNPVQQAWRALQDQRQALRRLHRPVPSSTFACDALATIVDAISASNTISSFSSDSRKTDRTTSRSAWNGAPEGNTGHCSFWENCQEIASQLVRAGLQSFSTTSLVACRENRLPVALGILSAAKDVPAVGKCMVTCDDVKSQLKTIEKTYSKEESIRQSVRQGRLDEIIRTRLLPKGRITGVTLLDYIAYLARIYQLEEERRTQTTISDSKRSRRFQHHLGSKMSDADIAEFGVLCRFVKA